MLDVTRIGNNVASLWNSRRKANHSQKNRNRRSQHNYGTLESKELLAGIVFLPQTGEVLIGGTTGADVAQVVQNGSQITVSHQGFGSETFAVADVNQIRFVGLAGDDRFENQSSIRSLAFGQAGNDTLIGGTGDDRLVGNNGNDQIAGNAGNDVLIAGIGDDIVFAGDGNDRVLGVNGINQINGGAGDDTLFGGQGDDTIVDPSGTNTIAGSLGNDEIRGGSGVDRIFAGPGNDLVFAGGGDDFVFGQLGNDTLVGDAGADVLNGNDGDDLIQGRIGDDRLVGGPGQDRAAFSGNTSEYRVESLGVNFSITDLRGSQFGGTDRLFALEQLDFSDGSHAPEDLVNNQGGSAERIFVQPIIAANTDGSNVAEFFGNASQQADIMDRIDAIFAQANVDVEFLPARRWNNTSVNVGSGSGTRSQSDLGTIVRGGDAAGFGSRDPRVVDIYFVERVPAFGDVAENVANGLAFVGASGIAMQTGDLLVNSSSGRAVVARVAAHEIAHNLGLEHTENSGNLLSSNSRATQLTPSQIEIILASQITQPI